MAKGNGGTRNNRNTSSNQNTGKGRVVDPRTLRWYRGQLYTPEVFSFLGYDYGEKPRMTLKDYKPIMWKATGSTAYDPKPEFYKMAKSFPERNIAVDNLIPMLQPLHENTVIDYYLNPDKDSTTGPIIGLKVYGTKQYVIANGTHRITAAMMRGEKSVKMRIYNVPKRFFKGLQKQQ